MNIQKAYLGKYVRFLAPFLKLQRPLRVVFDSSNGPAGQVVWKLLANHPKVQAAFLDSKVSGQFPAHGPDSFRPAARHHVAMEVLRRGADLGILFDGDGDRMFLFDHRGTWVPPPAVAMLLFLGEASPFVADIITAKMLEKTRFSAGIVHGTKVGSFFIKKEMRKQHASVGAEYSGHYYFKDFFGCDAGVLAALKVMNVVSALPYPLADFADLLAVPPHALFPVKVAKTEQALERLAGIYRKRGERIQRTDGVLVDGGEWWFVARPSHTEPLIRVFVGARKEKVLREKERELRHSIL